MFDDNLVTTLAIKRNITGQQLKQENSECININFPAVFTPPNFWRHVMKRSNTLSVTPTMRCRNELAQAIIPNFNLSQVIKNIAWFEITVHQTRRMQMMYASPDPSYPVVSYRL